MATHPLWRPYEQPTDEQVAAARVVPADPLPGGRIAVVPPDPQWPIDAAYLIQRVRDALGNRALDVQHVGSTAVEGLWAKPVIDLDLLVADSAAESTYVADLEAVGFRLTIREPEWEEHRCLVHDSPRCNLHVFSIGAIEPQRHRAFRDWLRVDGDDREKYAGEKRELAEQRFASVMAYNNDKAAVIYDIYERIFLADPKARHDPHPRNGATLAGS